MHEKVAAALKMGSAISRINDPLHDRQLLYANGKPVRNLKYCHELIRETAMALAGELYEKAMRDNENHATWKLMCNDMTSEQRLAEFIQLMWPRMIEDARATLARMLATSQNEVLKEHIYNALILDGQLRAKGKGPQPKFQHL